MTTNYPTKELRLPMPWGHIAAKAWGFPSDKPVLAIHGLLDNAGTFDRLIPLLPPGYYFVCIDLPGHGLSSHFPAGVALDYFDYILTVRRVLDYLKWKTCICMGHSFGGLLGLFYTAIYPTRMEKLICLDSDLLAVVRNEELSDRIRYTHDYALKNESHVNERLYTKEEVMYTLMYSRWITLNTAAAEALMKRSVTKVDNKYTWNHDPRLNIGLWPAFDYDQVYALSRKFDKLTWIILSDVSSINFQSNKLVKISNGMGVGKENVKFVTVEGNHNVHNNNPERVVPYVSQYLSNIKSNL